jgi:polysaccharide biosynthesis protein PslH
MIEAGIAAAKIGGRLSIDLDEDDLRSFESQADDAREQASRRESSEPDWLRAEGVACDRLVARHRRQFDRAWAASAYEVASLAARHQRLALRLAPNAIELPPRRSHAPCEPTALLVGSMGYQPNRRGAEWLVGDVWPRVRARSPDARLMIAGAPAPDHLASPQHNVFVLGHMGDLATLYAQASLCVAPLFCGGGTRIKLLEAAAYEVPIVATAIANRGLPFSQPESAWIADSPQDFAEACAEALSSRGEAARRATAARKLVAQFHDRGKIVSQLAGEFSELLSGGAKDGRSDGRRERHLHSHRGP